jgi:hypothetical protein
MSKLYFSYLMRIWRSQDALHEDWFASLEEPSTKKLIHFKSIEDLFEFIRIRSADPETITLFQNEEIM